MYYYYNSEREKGKALSEETKMNGNQMKQELVTLAKQVNAKELSFAKFRLAYDNDKNNISLVKGQKYMQITYNRGTDLYDVKAGKFKSFAMVETLSLEGVYSDQLRGLVEDHFTKFRYVMDSIVVHRGD
jgi:hypothetical protein